MSPDERNPNQTMNKLLTYHNDPKFKRAFVRETRWHRKQDRYINGTYTNLDNTASAEALANFKGCSIGCSVNSLKRLGKNSIAYNDHAGCATLLGWPEWLCHLQDTIFEGLPEVERATWTEKLAAAVPMGVELDAVKWRFCAALLRGNIKRVLGLTLDEKLKERVLAAIRQCLAVQEKAIATGKWDESAAAWSAESAAWSAARSAARSAATSRYGKILLRLLKATKPAR